MSGKAIPGLEAAVFKPFWIETCMLPVDYPELIVITEDYVSRVEI